MTSDVRNFLLKHPNFQIISETNHNFIGNIAVEDDVFQVEFLAPNFPSSSQISCKVLKGISEISLKKFQPDTSIQISDYLVILYDFLASSTQHIDDFIFSLGSLETFVEQLRKLSQDSRCKVTINSRYDALKLTNFKEYQDHYLELDVSKNFEVTVRHHSLPDKDSIGNDLFAASGCLEVIVGQFWRLLEQFIDFYSNLNTIDELCTVIEPVKVTTKHNWRLFRITDKVLGRITFDPLASSAIVLHFIGPTLEVEKYRRIYNENLRRWDIDLDVYRNLLRIFDLMYFPMRSSRDETESKYCNICYMYTLDDHVPIISCDNPRCDLLFHVACLKQWFTTLKDGKTFLSVTFGSCPSCKEKLSPSFVQLLEV